MQYYRTMITTIVGQLTLVGSELGLYAVLWESDSLTRVRLPMLLEENKIFPLFIETEQQLSEYFLGQRKHFTVQLDFRYGTTFQQLAWRALQAIPYGEVRTYAQQAQVINNPKAIRAIGSANGRNPLSIIVPCHRVIASNGTLGGFAGGLSIKQQLLDIERTALNT